MATIGVVRESPPGPISGRSLGRPKHIYSIYKKMDRKEVGFDQVLMCAPHHRQDNPTCYYVLGVIHNLWRPSPPI
jgi:GTP pyrophosphokinase